MFGLYDIGIMEKKMETTMVYQGYIILLQSPRNLQA